MLPGFGKKLSQVVLFQPRTEDIMLSLNKNLGLKLAKLCNKARLYYTRHCKGHKDDMLLV